MEADQVARNDAIYRAANERIEAAAEEYEVAGPIPFICECADATCTNIVLLTLTQYERIRAHPQTVRAWLRSGKLKGYLPGGKKLGYRVPASEVERFLRAGQEPPA